MGPEQPVPPGVHGLQLPRGARGWGLGFRSLFCFSDQLISFNRVLMDCLATHKAPQDCQSSLQPMHHPGGWGWCPPPRWRMSVQVTRHEERALEIAKAQVLLGNSAPESFRAVLSSGARLCHRSVSRPDRFHEKAFASWPKSRRSVA